MHKLIRPRVEYSCARLTTEEASALLQEAERQAPKSAAAHSLYIGISLALRLGLRRGEVFGLRWEDVDLKGQRLMVARSFDALPKNGKPRTLPIPRALLPALEKWKAVCPKPPKVGQKVGQKVCPIGTNCRTGLARLLHAARCQPLVRGWHGLRHTFASIFVEQGGSILALKEMLGHSSLAMSLVYAHLAPSALAGDIEKMKL